MADMWVVPVLEPVSRSDKRSEAAWWMVALLVGIGMILGAAPATAADRAGSKEPRSPAPSGTSDPMTSDAMRSDAALADVGFVDRQQGWAVGDRGAIWHTEDGGRRWTLQDSGVACRLEAVCFLNRENGWAAGGFSHPYLHTGAGVLLVTQDGGQHWTRDTRNLLPPVKQMRMLGPRFGWMIGGTSGLFPSGALVATDAGRTWNPQPGPRSPGWVAGDYFDPDTAAAAAHSGALACLRRGILEPARAIDFGLRTPARIRLAESAPGWLVGAGGLILTSVDGGASWQALPQGPPWALLEQFDLAALAVRGPKCWIAGSPGTRVFFSPDAGRSWTVFSTGQSAPIHALCFLDDDHGIAVGALGTILATGNGGRTWTRQRAGGSRAAVLGIFGEPGDAPLELFARLSGNEGYLSVLEFVARRDVESPPRGKVPLADRAYEALMNLGACGARTAWQFPLRQPGVDVSEPRILDAWNRIHNGHGLAALEAYLVRQIRLWRPELIVTRGAAVQGDDPLGHVLQKVVLQAAVLAADATAHRQQLDGAGLAPWQVRRVIASLGPALPGPITLSAGQLADRLGCSLGELADRARPLLTEGGTPQPQTLGFQILFDQIPDQGRRDFLGGIAIAPGSEARRTLSDSVAESLDVLRRTAQKRRTTRAIVEHSRQDSRSGRELLAQVGQLMQGLDPASAAELLDQLGRQYHRVGQWGAAAETLGLLVQQYPDHPLARPAIVWLVNYYASAEVAWRSAEQTAGERQSPLSGAMPGQEDRLQRLAALAARVQQKQPDLYAEPSIGFCLAAVDRQRRQSSQAERFYTAQRRSTTHDAWWACAQGEASFFDPKRKGVAAPAPGTSAAPGGSDAQQQGFQPKPTLRCAKAAVRPRLDGKLDDPLWQTARRAELHSPQGEDAAWPASMLMAYDDRFLYLAMEARQAPGGNYEPATGQRLRDGDLSRRDRVDVYLDLNRDYATYYHLAIDSRGWTTDDCWGDSTWNPQWFVAASTADGVWTAEAAIPLGELSATAPVAGAAWAIGLQRTIGGVGFQSWNAPAAVDVMPEGFGYLIFD